MGDRTPYVLYNYLVSVASPATPLKVLGGVSDASGLPSGAGVTGKNVSITLKRGVLSAPDLWQWLNAARAGGSSTKWSVLISLRNEVQAVVLTWKLVGVLPVKYTGPTLSGKGNGDIAIEELVLSAESVSLS